MKKSHQLRRNRSLWRAERSKPRFEKSRRTRFEKLEDRCLLSSVGLGSLSDVTMQAGSAIYIPLNGTDTTTTQPINFAVTVSDYSQLTPVLMPQSNNTLQFTVQIPDSSGNLQPEQMNFQLLDNLAPNTAKQIETLVGQGFYNGLTIYRNATDSSGNPWVIQGGAGETSTAGTPIPEEFNPNLQFTSGGLLAMARTSVPGTSATDFFVTEEADRQDLDYNYTIFGVQTTGQGVVQQIAAMSDVAGSDSLTTPVTISNASIIADVQDGVLELRAPSSAMGSVTVTVTANDGTSTSAPQTFNVIIASPSTTAPANPFASVIPQTPTSLAFLPPTGASSQITGLNNSSSSTTLKFQVTGVTSGDTVEILADGTPIGQAIATDSTSPITVTTDATTKLTDGVHTFTAIQIAPQQTVSVNESGSSTPTSSTADVPGFDSPSVQLTVDTVPPQLTFTPGPAVVGVPYIGQATATSESGGAVTYQLTNAPTDMSINATTGQITWTPQTADLGQTSSVQMTVQATDPIGNTASQTYAINALAANSAPVLTPESPSLGSTAEDTPLIINLSAFINTATGTQITDSDTNAVIGGIALTGVTGQGTWAYSLDSGATFTTISASAFANSSALLLPQNAELQYTPGNHGAETATITYRAWDTTGGTAGASADLSQFTPFGGSTPFSINADTASLTVYGASVSGYVYADVDNDGLRITPSGQPKMGIPGVVITLSLQNGTAWTPVAGKSPVMTDSNGYYSFTALAAGTYQIQESQPTDYLDGQETVGTIGGVTTGTSSTNQFQVQLTSGQDGIEYNFGEQGLNIGMISLRMSLASAPTGSQFFVQMDAPPVVKLSQSAAGNGYSTTFTSGGSPAAIAATDAAITDADSSMLASLTARITNLLDGSSETLTADTTGTSIQSSYANGVLMLSGVADLATYDQVLASIKYSDTAASPNAADRLIDIFANDGITDGQPATATVHIQTVERTATTTSIAVSANPSAYGASVTFTATVTSSSGSGTPTGSVTFMDGNTTLGTGTLTNGTASLATAGLTLGDHSVTAVYGGDANFATSTSATLTQTVGQAATSTTVAASANPSAYGASVTFTATVASSSGGGTPTGSVTFMDGDTSLGTATLTNGAASFATGALTLGDHSITAVYGGDANFITSTSNALTQTVGQAATATSVAPSSNPSTYGDSVTFTATVASSSGGGSPTGIVTFMDGDTTLGTGSLTGGTASFATADLALGDHSVTAVYGGDANFIGSTSDTLTQTVKQASSASIAASANPSTYGDSVTFTATVTSSSGGGTPTGTVTFMDGDTALGTGTLTNGTASFTTTALTVGDHSITAVYGGDANFVTSTSDTLTQTVQQAATSTSVAPSANPSAFGASVTFTATVASSSGGGTPTGIVTFMDGDTALGTGTLTNGTATFATADLALGDHSVTAVYGGDANFSSSTSDAITQTVQQAATTTSVAPSANPSAYGASVTFTATVTSSSGGGTPTGIVTFMDGNTALGTGTLTNGTASFTTTALIVGDHSVTAVYGGDANFVTSTSDTLTQTVQQAATATTVAPSANPSAYGASVTFTATVASSSGGGTPTGIVTFMDGDTALGTGSLTGGTASFATADLALGDHSITAVYGGDANFVTSTSDTLTQTVQQAATATTVAPSANPSAFGASVTFTATVASSSGGGTPTGIVTFMDGDTALGTGSLTGGTASFATADLALGDHSVTAVYGGDANFIGSTSDILTQTIA